eukprot:scaffold35454_cov51-Attheya_sp.AAC.2
MWGRKKQVSEASKTTSTKHCEIFVEGWESTTSTTESKLRSIFEEVGPIVNIEIPIDPWSGKPRDFAFITYSSRRDAIEAVQKFDKAATIDKRKLRVMIAPTPKQRKLIQERYNPPVSTLCCCGCDEY